MLRKFIPLLVFALLVTSVVQIHTVEASQKENIISIAKKQLGVPYRYGGTTTSGFDCSGFILHVMNQVGVSLPRTVSGMHQKGTAVSKANLSTGDLVFFKTVTSGPSHAGIYIGNNKFIHSASSKGVSISSINDPYYWGSRYIGAKRVLASDVEMAAAPIVEKIDPPRVLGEGEYNDVLPAHWAFTEIKLLSKSNMISGSGQNQFTPNEKVTRAQLATFITRAKGLPTDSGVNGFRDVPEDHWAARAIAASDREGFFSYLDGETFNMDQSVTREEVAIVLTKAFNLATTDTTTSFADVDESNQAYDDIQALQASGIINGFSDGTYRPTNNITRAEFAKVLHTALN